MDTQNNKIAAQAFAAAFASALSEALEQTVGTPWPLEMMDGHKPPATKSQPAQFRLKVDGGLRGECFVEFYEPQISELLTKLGGAEAEPAAGDEAKSLTPVISTASASLKTTLATRYGDLSFAVDAVSGLAFGGMFVVPLAAPADRSGAAVLLYFDGQLMDALSSAAGSENGEDAEGRLFHPSNLKLVMDVELNVCLRFGQRQLPLREVLELKSGSVIELDRMVDEPVELLLDGKLVARGEAVIVDGNYGLRVTEIPQAIETHFLR
ncbi:MAG TPA: flagellar motor switch protein FliN [Terracidiphilus sp.]|nr:flagellar motor switch protein FliN [Terracidiphilus sp.]